MENDLTITVDTHEKNPLDFSLLFERGVLATGDYSLRALERVIAIER